MLPPLKHKLYNLAFQNGWLINCHAFYNDMQIDCTMWLLWLAWCQCDFAKSKCIQHAKCNKTCMRIIPSLIGDVKNNGWSYFIILKTVVCVSLVILQIIACRESPAGNQPLQWVNFPTKAFTSKCLWIASKLR